METNIAPAPAPSAPQIPPLATPAPAPLVTDGTNPPPAPTPDPKENDPGEFAKRFAEINKQAQKIRDEQKRLAEERKTMDMDREEYQRWKKAKESKDAIAILESAGLTYADATERVLKDKQLTPEEKIEALQKRLDDEAAAREAEKASKEAEAADRAVAEYLQGIRSHVAEKSDQYELIQARGAHEMVLEVIEEYWNANQQLPDLDVACQHVESYLEEQVRPLLGLKKFAPQKSESLPAEGTNGKSPPQSFTITNQSTAAPAQTRDEYLSDEESLKRSAAMLRWN